MLRYTAHEKPASAEAFNAGRHSGAFLKPETTTARPAAPRGSASMATSTLVIGDLLSVLGADRIEEQLIRFAGVALVVRKLSETANDRDVEKARWLAEAERLDG